MYVMIVVALLSTGMTNEQRLYPFPSAQTCEAALKAAVAAWEVQKARIVASRCEPRI